MLGLVIAALSGCGVSRETPTFDVPAGAYPQAFEAAKAVLREHRFTLDRVDARAGVILTEQRHSAGLATPWDADQATAEDELQDLLNRRQRTVRVVFAPPVASTTTGSSNPTASSGLDNPRPTSLPPELDPLRDLRATPGPLVARVQVVVERLNRPNLQLSPRTVRLRNYTYDPDLIAGGQTRVDDDVALSKRLAGEMLAELDKRLNASDKPSEANERNDPNGSSAPAPASSTVTTP
ncbi:MAG: hypothetical protein SFZ23_12765 [Planctomycetota bacterium]|nr:hypothetical protein [Planctomycetota bacterium]